MAEDTGTIEIVAEAPPWMIFVRWMRVSIRIDGALARFSWGSHLFRVAPGSHSVVVGTGSAFANKAEITIVVAVNEVVRLRYTPRLIKHVAGDLVVERLPVARLLTRSSRR